MDSLTSSTYSRAYRSHGMLRVVREQYRPQFITFHKPKPKTALDRVIQSRPKETPASISRICIEQARRIDL